MRVTNICKCLTTFLILILPASLFSQSVKLSGRVIDAETTTPLVGASVTLSNSSKGAITDVEGKFFITIEQGKQYSIKVTNIGYQPKELNDISSLNADGIEISLQKATADLEAVVVTSSVRKESSASLYLAQKNSSSISDGISAEVIRKSPDRNSSDVLKRVSGASIQDNKFVIIRGLNERYNTGLLNNAVLPSTEADKKAFSFDILPSSIIDNIVIYKSPTPDLPGDFSGGAVKVTTRDYPSRKLSDLSVSVGYNSLTTFKNFYRGFPEGKTDWLGYFDDSRLIPNSYYQNKGSKFIGLPDADKTFISKQFSNTYGYEAAYESTPNINVSYTGGNTKLLNGGKKLGYIYSLSYSTGRSASERSRDEYQTYGAEDYLYNTNNYAQNANLSALLNVTYSFGKSKISLKNLYNNAFSKSVGIRDGYNIVNGQDGKFLVKSTNTEAAANGIINSVLDGLHSLNSGWSVDWNLSYGNTYKWEPDQKILALHTNPGADIYNLTLSNENSPEISNAGRVYSFLKENIYGGNLNVTKQFTLWGEPQKFKIGASNFYRDRNFEADALGYALLLDAGVSRISIAETKTTTFNNIFSAENIDTYKLTVANIPANTIGYHGTALMNAGYLMFDNKFSSHLKLTWGARVENYNQKITAEGRTDTKHSNFDVLPSFVFTYALSPKTNVRLAGSQAVNRPEFRELADYRVYDYNNEVILLGNPNLERSKNTNGDLRYEWFPSAGEVISASVFYKYFKSPIEQVNNGNNILSWANATSANTYGAEIEVRKKLAFINNDFFNHLTFYVNAAYMDGSVKFDTTTYNSPMQGQSPYLINGGLFYSSDNDDFSVNVLYNRIGSRLRYRAILGATRDIYEKPRNVLDFQISKKIIKNKLEARLTVSDLLAQPYTWYYKFNKDASNVAYDASSDRIMQTTKNGSTVTVSLKYSLGN